MGGQVVLSIGDKVKVEITGVDEDLRRVSAWVVEAQAQDAKGKVQQFVPSLAAPATLREQDFVKERSVRPERGRRDDKPTGSRPPSGRPPGPSAKPAGPGADPSGRANGPPPGPSRPRAASGAAPRRNSAPSNCGPRHCPGQARAYIDV